MITGHMKAQKDSFGGRMVPSPPKVVSNRPCYTTSTLERLCQETETTEIPIVHKANVENGATDGRGNSNDPELFLRARLQ